MKLLQYIVTISLILFDIFLYDPIVNYIFCSTVKFTVYWIAFIELKANKKKNPLHFRQMTDSLLPEIRALWLPGGPWLLV